MIAAYASALSGLNAASTRLAERADRLIRSSAGTGQGAAFGGDLSTAGSETGPPAAGPPTREANDARDTELVNDLVGLGYDKTAFKANLAVLRSARETEARLLDIIT